MTTNSPIVFCDYDIPDKDQQQQQQPPFELVQIQNDTRGKQREMSDEASYDGRQLDDDDEDKQPLLLLEKESSTMEDTHTLAARWPTIVYGVDHEDPCLVEDPGEQEPDLPSEEAVEAALADEPSTTATTTTTFVKYIPPPPLTPPPPPLNMRHPPAKYKLCLMILVLVYIAEWLAAEAGIYDALRRGGWLSHNSAVFVVLCLIVGVLILAGFEFVMRLLSFSYHDRLYGLGPWMKQPRVQWARRRDLCLPVELVACVVVILEDGFSMFDAQQQQQTTMNDLPHSAGSGDQQLDTTGSSADDSEVVPPCRGEDDHQEDGAEEDNDVVVKIQQQIDPTKSEEFTLWRSRIEASVKQHARGLTSVRCFYGDYGDEEDRRTNIELENGNVVEIVEEGTRMATQQSLEYGDYERGDADNNNQHLFTVYLTFEHINHVHEWMASPIRQRYMEELEPLLVKPLEAKIRRQLQSHDRRDAFTDLLVRQGDATPRKPPKKWKVWWMTLIGLFFTKLWTGHVLPYYVEQWGMTSTHTRWRNLVSLAITIFLNSYVMVPTLLFLFHGWVQRKSHENDTKEPWRTLNDGFSGFFWWRGFVTLAFYGGCLIAWGVKTGFSIST